VPNPRYYRKMLTKLAKQDRKVARRRRRAKKEHRRLLDSRNYQKARRQRANLHSHIAHQRNDFLHRTSTVLIQNHDLIVSEELRGKNMLK
ncbi:transposase, partial [Secundilactobacillus similis]